MALVHTVSIETATTNPALLGAFVRYVPPILDSSPSLTATVACCLEACKQKELHPTQRKVLDIGLYGHALKSIHIALQDRGQRDSDATFLAVVLMQRLETALVTKGIARIPCWSVHAGGVSDLLRYRGAFDPKNKLIFEAMLENIGPIVAHWIEKEEDCFLEAPEWQVVLQCREDTKLADRILLGVVGQLIFLPRLLRMFREARDDHGSVEGAMDLAMSMAVALRNVDNMLEDKLFQDVSIVSRSNAGWDAPVNCFYEDVKQKDARAICWHVILSIIINNALVALIGLKARSGCSKDFSGCVEELKRYNLILSRRAWMLATEARQCGLMVYYFYTGALVTSYKSAQSADHQNWIISLLNELHRSDESDALWTHEIVERSSRAFTASV
ncbi:hypothetical protein CLAFUW4_05436 [Fulvia fulva]|uniref:Uncharacterized protein n=1 Tax=Passalora fulva TaxID=5499 RepID=A0A9Q8LGR9_PASFU|nr:uncharacterized protein CLAFUR5_05581 [Fulvia fulva]KAK4624047.1 hypothetical protein CLAFUR4_05430 [Fulvia fulva]KAK4625857.1 hypothetical protein CLAFUR0_05438 [Fulvia fulva]UJO17195.1 hypothetical protein CLAFUR5_05581 [Fulvia fulva]WPV15267.1 hypothetical protein CLAFUW4_05436 [Fulvia fulva]WPV29407.1 hypothetical protein CLAFUW7_05434 [Fulvia fulva]